MGYRGFSIWNIGWQDSTGKIKCSTYCVQVCVVLWFVKRLRGFFLSPHITSVSQSVNQSDDTGLHQRTGGLGQAVIIIIIGRPPQAVAKGWEIEPHQESLGSKIGGLKSYINLKRTEFLWSGSGVPWGKHTLLFPLSSILNPQKNVFGIRHETGII